MTTYYNTRDGVILSQTDGTNTMYFQYDTNGIPLGFIYNDTQYFYMTNQMGDVIAVTDSTGIVVGNYEYDAWGNVFSAKIVLRAFIKGYITITSVALDAKLLGKISNKKYEEMLNLYGTHYFNNYTLFDAVAYLPFFENA